MALSHFYLDDDQQFPAIRIENSHGVTEISLYGGQVVSFVPANKKQFGIWKNPHAIYRKGKAIRGGIPVCFPWFSQHITDKSLPQHGFARTAMWEFESHEIVDGKEYINIALSDTPETRAIWNYGFKLTLSVCCDRHLAVALTAHNTDDKPWTFSAALHSYISVSDITKVSIDCGEIKQLIDSAKGNTPVVLNGPIHIDRPIDWQYIQCMSEGRFNPLILNDTGKKRAQRLRIGPSFQLWNPWIEGSCKFDDMHPDAYKSFICIEPAILQRLPVNVKPRKSSTLVFAI